MLNLKPYPQKILLYLLLAFLFNSCQKQADPYHPTPNGPEKPDPVLSFKFVKFERVDKLTDLWNNVKIYWSKAKSTVPTDGVKYTVSLNGKVVAPDISDTTCYLANVLATFSYKGKIVVNGLGKKDSIEFEIPANRGFVYASPDLDGINCYTTEGQFVWRHNIENWLTPVLSNDTLFLQGRKNATPQSVVCALSAKTGEVLWSVPNNIGYDTPVSLVYSKGIILATSSRDTYAFRASDGTELWHKKQNSTNINIPVPRIFGNLVLTVGGDELENNGLLKAYDANTGILKWTFVSPLSGMGAPTLKDNVVYIVDTHIPPFEADEVCALNAIDATTGVKKWTTPYMDGGAGTAFYRARPLVVGNMVIFSTYSRTLQGYLYAFNKDTGKLLWKNVVFEGTLAADASGLYLFNASNAMKFNLQNGALIWSKPSYYYQFILTPGKIYLTSAFSSGIEVMGMRVFDSTSGAEDLYHFSPFLKSAGQMAVVIDGVAYYSSLSEMVPTQ
ncbi:PQQ-binding-like beta-propeller repeat protein [Mucilaginibacter sp. CAU 1740]|uniref:PQQ-binding-like beta-propeller repeat protein n=1 Tax=Mucilaginibacter sp. CAU 1740 TaxID=3140365 RepID=UPI00325AE299